MSRLIGIVPTARLFANDDPYQDNYVFVNHYVRRVTEAGGVPVTLGKRILRTETAPLAALSVIMYASGNMEP